MQILIYVVLFTILLYLFRIEIQNKLTFSPVPEAPLIPQGTFHSIFFNNPRDQAMEKCAALVPDSSNLGFFVTQLLFNRIVFIVDETYPKVKLYSTLQFVFGNGVFFANDAVWGLHRHTLSSAFPQSRFGDIILDAFDELSAVWNSQIAQDEGSSVVPVFEWADRAVFQTMGLFSFNKNTQSIAKGDSNLYDMYVNLMKMLSVPTLFLHILKFNPKTVKNFPYYSKFYALVVGLRNEFQKIIDERRADLSAMAEVDKKEQKDVLARILLSLDRKPDYDDSAIVDDMISLFAAGHETVAITIAYTSFYLAKYPAYQVLVREEAKAFYKIHGKSSATMPLSKLEKELPILRRVLYEVWRLMPPAAGTLTRVVDSDDVYLSGMKIPKGTNIFISIYNAHRCERTWGSDAAEFRPERFCVDGILKNDLNDMPGKLLTFGHGPRSCLGTLFGTVEGILGISKLASEFWFDIPAGSPNGERIITKRVLAVLSPANLELRIRKIN